MGDYKDPHEAVASRVDELEPEEDAEKNYEEENIVYQSPELKKVEENLKFIKKLIEHPIAKDVHAVDVFGVETVDPRTVVYGNNIWNRSIFSVDELCDIHDSATLEQQLKYRKKKRKVESKMAWLLIVLGIAGLAITILVLFLMGVI